METCEWQMTIYPFVARSTQFWATHALCKIGELFSPGYDQPVPVAITTLFYVDDCLACFATAVEAVKFATDISKLLAQGDSELGNGPPMRQSY